MDHDFRARKGKSLPLAPDERMIAPPEAAIPQIVDTSALMDSSCHKLP